VGPGVSEQVFAGGGDVVGGGEKTGSGVAVTVTGTVFGAGCAHPAAMTQSIRTSGISNRKAFFIAKNICGPRLRLLLFTLPGKVI
jgi:hypothetical protein